VAALRSAQLAETASESSLRRAQQTVVFTVASNFVGLVKQQEQLRVQRENLAALQAQERQIRAFVDAGSRPISDLYQQQAAVASAQVAVVGAERALELAKVDVMQTLQLDPRGSYEFAPPALGATTGVATGAEEDYDLDSLLARALSQRADVDARETLVGAAEQDVRAAGASRLPTVSVSAGYNTSFSSAADIPFADQLDQRRGGSVSIGVSLPIFDRGSTDLASQRARIAADNARIALENQRQQVGLEVRRAYLDYQSARQQLQAAEAQQRAAALALESTQQRYDVGAATLLEVTQARASQVQATSALVSARYDLLLQRTVMDYYAGDLDPRNVTLG
jgi:outer membrane protein